jgi:hypothetical protein
VLWVVVIAVDNGIDLSVQAATFAFFSSTAILHSSSTAIVANAIYVFAIFTGNHTANPHSSAG